MKPIEDFELEIIKKYKDMTEFYITEIRKSYDIVKLLSDAGLIQVPSYALTLTGPHRVKREDLTEIRRLVGKPLLFCYRTLHDYKHETMTVVLSVKDTNVNLSYETPILPNGKCKVVESTFTNRVLVCET